MDLNEKLSNKYGKGFRLVTLMAASGLVVFLLVLGTTSFKDPLFNMLFPKPRSEASTGAVNNPSVRGVVVSVDYQSLKLKIGGSVRTYSLLGTIDFQRLVSGTAGTDSAVYEHIRRTYLNAGDEVLVTTRSNSESVLKVVIIK